MATIRRDKDEELDVKKPPTPPVPPTEKPEPPTPSSNNNPAPEGTPQPPQQPVKPETEGNPAPVVAPVTPPPSNYSEVITYLTREMGKAETPEEKKKRERREKWDGIISGIGDAVSSLSNLYFTTKGAPNAYDPTQSMSAKAKERREKAKAERERQADRYVNYALTIGKLKDADRDFAYRLGRDAVQDSRYVEQFNYQKGRAKVADEQWQKGFDFQTERAGKQDEQWQKTFDRQGEWHKEEADRWERQFKESIRQFNVNSARQQQALALQAKQLAHQMSQGSMTFNLGTDHGNVTLTQAQLNAQNVSRIYYTLPKSIRDNVHGTPIYGTDIAGNKIVTGYGDPSTEAMLIAIGQHLSTGQNTQATRDAIKQVAGLQKGNTKLPAAY